MPKSNAIFVWAAAAGCLVAIGIARTAYAEVEHCLTRPGAEAPVGRHWHYTIDRATHRRCWALGVVGGRPHSHDSTTEQFEQQRKPQSSPGGDREDDTVPMRAERPAASHPAEGGAAESNASPAGFSMQSLQRSSVQQTPLQETPEFSTGSGLGLRSTEVPEVSPGPSEIEPEQITQPAPQRDVRTVASTTPAPVASLPAKEGTPLRSVLILFAGTLLASGVARLAFKLSGSHSI